ncbi:MAG: porin family protein [Gammaproteobacteria bacterium]|nr:porin family protein [Gammaproteobacteria bacterium]
MNKKYNHLFAVTLLLLFPLTSMGKEITQGSTGISGQTSLVIADSELSPDAGGTVDTSATEVKGGIYYFPVDNLGVGLSFNRESTDVKLDASTSTSAVTVIGPQAVYNVSLNDKVSLAPNIFVGYANITLGATGTEDQTISGLGYGGGANLNFFITDNIFTGIGIQYVFLNLEDDLNNKATQSTLGGSFSFGLILP